MKTKLSISILLMFVMMQTKAQQFISKAVIEYEVKQSIKKTLGGGNWAEMMKDNISTFKTSYCKLNFANNKSIYKFDRWDESTKLPDWFKKDDEGTVWYLDHNTNRMSMQKNIFGSDFFIEDSIPNIEWRLSNENRIIAGYNCRKAIGKIMDSVYVFVFYTDEITIPGGPCSISGLPGTILGMTIPRMYTSWIATKVDIDKADEKLIVPVNAKKTYTKAAFNTMLKERTKDWFSDDDPDSQKWIEQFRWRAGL
ncbi:MAG: GLPGLI family protein [Bacteroidetes bacterium]|nr:GLPGLI family protein [Bacteroidota bacterium]